MGNYQSKTLPQARERNKERCEQRRGVVAVPVVVEPVVVRLPATLVPVPVADVQIAVPVAVCIGCHPYHCPSNAPQGHIHFSNTEYREEKLVLSRLNRIRHHNALAPYTKYLHF